MSFWRLRPTSSELERWAREKIVNDAIKEGLEAKLLWPFEYREPPEEEKTRGFPLMYAAQQGEQHREHNPQPFRKFHVIEVPSNIEEIPVLQYDPLDYEKDPIRLLALLPHEGDQESAVQCVSD
jgi:hypothetical protein